MKKLTKCLLLAFLCIVQAGGSLCARTAADTLTLTEVKRDVEKRVKEYHALTFHVHMALPTGTPALTRSAEAWVEQLFADETGIAPAGPTPPPKKWLHATSRSSRTALRKRLPA